MSEVERGYPQGPGAGEAAGGAGLGGGSRPGWSSLSSVGPWSAAGFLLLIVGLVDCVNFSVDDAFIPLRYAENLARGLGLVFNPGQRVEGFSNLLWTLVLGGLAACGVTQHTSELALLIAAKLMGGALGVATFVLAAWFVLRLQRLPEWAATAPLGLALLCLGGAYPFALWSISGMETSLCALCVTAGGAAYVLALRRLEQGERAGGLLTLGGLAFGVATLVRAEQVFIWALAMAVAVFVVPRPLRKHLAWSAALTLAVFVPSVLWRWAYYGDPVPNSVVAKAGGGVLSAVLGGKYTLSGVVFLVGYLGLGLVGLGGLWKSGAGWRFLICYCGAFLGFIGLSGGDWMPGYRYFVPLLPLLFVLCAAALTRGVAGYPWRRWAYAICAVMAVGSFFAGRTLVRAQQMFPSGMSRLSWNAEPLRLAVAKDVRDRVPRGSVLAIAECGCIPYYNPDIVIMDVMGLMDKQIARMPGLHMRKLGAAAFLERDPDYYLMMLMWGTPSGEGVELLHSPVFQERYEVVAYYDGMRAGLDAVQRGRAAPGLQEAQSFILYRRRPRG